MYQTLLLLNRNEILNVYLSGQHFTSYQCAADQSISYGSTYHLLFAIPSVLIFIICNVLPPLLLTLYPIRAFRSCLSKCYLNSITLNTFTDRVYGCYRNGLDGGRDMRCIAGLYFILRLVPFLIKLITRSLHKHHTTIHWYYSGAFFFATALTVGIAKPYKRAYMNYLDTLILSNLSLTYYCFVSESHPMVQIRTLLAIPILTFIIVMTIKIIRSVGRPLLKCIHFKLIIRIKTISPRTKRFHREEELRNTIDSPTAAQPLIEPTSTVLNYGTCVSNYGSEDPTTEVHV